MISGDEWKGEPTFDLDAYMAAYMAEQAARDPFWMGYYILDDAGEPKPIADLMEWARWCEGNRRVAQTIVGLRISVSTVFLGLDHSFARHTGQPHAPVLWETMSFWHGDPNVEIPENQERYTSRANALKGHARHVAIATRFLQEMDAKKGANYGKKP